jgi:hypothetical protein
MSNWPNWLNWLNWLSWLFVGRLGEHDRCREEDRERGCAEEVSWSAHA